MKIDRAEAMRRAIRHNGHCWCSKGGATGGGLPRLPCAECRRLADVIEQAVKETAEECIRIVDGKGGFAAGNEILRAFGLDAPSVGGSPTPDGGGESKCP